MQNNLTAVLRLIQFIYDNIIYAELNTKSDYCQVCGYLTAGLDGKVIRSVLTILLVAPDSDFRVDG